ncbi:MAG: formylglycine-generating enzyme family protein [Comamonadaceae bacterium]|nr:MAG: formylglycine-generating enzyme family protein [Comamonadaceae bacterium]
MHKLLATLALAAAATTAAAADAGPRYRPLPGASFTSVLPQGPVATASAPVAIEPFALREAPVTVGEFAAFVRTHPEWARGQAPAVLADARYLLQWASPLDPGHGLQAGQPVTEVSWFAARAYCEGEGARLPTWLEWEYAAAADATRTDARADPAWRRSILSWYEKPGGEKLDPVGGPANAYGVRNLHGLVWEWVDDFNALFIAGDSRTQGDPDKLKFCGAGALSIIDRDSYAVLMRIALLSSLNAADTTGTLGFRCARRR